MKTKILSAALLLALTTVAGAQKSKPNTAAKEAIDYAVSMNLSGNPGRTKGVDEPAYVYLNPSVHLVETSQVKMYPNHMFPASIKQFVVKAGMASFRVKYETMYEKSDEADVVFHFEEGKIYLLSRRIKTVNKLDFFIEEVTDPEKIEYAMRQMKIYDRENIRAREAKYLEYSEAHPARLDGVWTGKKKSRYDPGMKFTINGDRITYEGARTANDIFIAEGRLFYNGNTMIMIPQRATRKGKEITDFNREADYVWYYKMEDGQLNLLESSRRFYNVYTWENTGEFTSSGGTR
jgi:hypothetical protein